MDPANKYGSGSALEGKYCIGTTLGNVLWNDKDGDTNPDIYTQVLTDEPAPGTYPINPGNIGWKPTRCLPVSGSVAEGVCLLNRSGEEDRNLGSFRVWVVNAFDCRQGVGDKPPEEGEYERLTKQKIWAIFRAANGAQAGGKPKIVLLPAFGCGLFANNPLRMAQMFREVLQEDEFIGANFAVEFVIPTAQQLLGRTRPTQAQIQEQEDVYRAFNSGLRLSAGNFWSKLLGTK